jgi:hypothetical protein
MNFKAIQLSFLFNPLNLLNRPRVQPRIIENDADLFLIWEKLILQYFPEKSELLSNKIRWSKRPQKRVLASCNIEKRVVTVAPAMQLPESYIHLESLIYHELCHAVAGISMKNGRRDIHSKSFKSLEALHPGIKELDRWIKMGGWINAVRKSTRKINKEKLLRRTF